MIGLYAWPYALVGALHREAAKKNAVAAEEMEIDYLCTKITSIGEEKRMNGRREGDEGKTEQRGNGRDKEDRKEEGREEKVDNPLSLHEIPRHASLQPKDDDAEDEDEDEEMIKKREREKEEKKKKEREIQKRKERMTIFNKSCTYIGGLKTKGAVWSEEKLLLTTSRNSSVSELPLVLISGRILTKEELEGTERTAKPAKLFGKTEAIPFPTSPFSHTLHEGTVADQQKDHHLLSQYHRRRQQQRQTLTRTRKQSRRRSTGLIKDQMLKKSRSFRKLNLHPSRANGSTSHHGKNATRFGDGEEGESDGGAMAGGLVGGFAGVEMMLENYSLEEEREGDSDGEASSSRDQLLLDGAGGRGSARRNKRNDLSRHSLGSFAPPVEFTHVVSCYWWGPPSLRQAASWQRPMMSIRVHLDFDPRIWAMFGMHLFARADSRIDLSAAHR